MSAGKAQTEARWQQLAQERGWGARLLLPVTWLYALLSALRRWLYRVGLRASHQLPVPVVVVGNVVVGGAGKTPATIAIVQHLKAAGWRPGVVSRGHGRKSAQPLSVTPDTPATEAGDEPRLIAQATGVPVFVSSNRVLAARSLLTQYPATNILVCDDGLQHLALQRDVEVVVFDDRGLGNGWLLPSGLLREPWPRVGVTRKPALILRQYRAGGQARELPVPDGARAFDARRSLAGRAMDLQGHPVELSALRGMPLIAMAGIARPQAFFSMLRGQGLTLAQEIALPDHASLPDYIALMPPGANAFICTEKDAVKLSALSLPQGARVWSVALKLDIDRDFFTALDAHLPPPTA